MKPLFKAILLIITLVSASSAYAICIRSLGIMTTADSYATPINFGKFNLSSAYLQPVGSILGYTVVPPTHRNAAPDAVLWICDASDLPNIYFLVATNGDEPFGGHAETGLIDGLAGVYATWWQYVGLKQTMGDVTLSRYWKKLDIKSYEQANGKIYIRLMDIPPLEATLYRISSLPSYSRGTLCNKNMVVSGSYSSGKLPSGSTASCNQPSAYIQLSGNSLVSLPLHDQIGDDSNSSFLFWGVSNGFPYGLNTAANTALSQTPTCAARSASPIVNFAAMPAAQLKNGATQEVGFNVEIECSNLAISGTANDQTAIGFQPSSAAYLNAQKLKLLNGNDSAEYLVSDDYENALSAKGVGIQLQHPVTHTAMRFLNQHAVSGGGQAAGWYPVLEGNPAGMGTQQSGYSRYLQQYKAILKKLPNIDPTPGAVKATATVVVKVQ